MLLESIGYQVFIFLRFIRRRLLEFRNNLIFNLNLDVICLRGDCCMFVGLRVAFI